MLTWNNIATGPEFWLALTILCMGAAISLLPSIALTVKWRYGKMINAYHLIWIIPTCVTAGMFFAAILWINGR